MLVHFQPCSPKTALKENLQKKNKDRRHLKAFVSAIDATIKVESARYYRPMHELKQLEEGIS
jgi:hypothetical protein